MTSDTSLRDALAAALMHIGVARENVASIGNAERWVPDTDAADAIIAAEPRLSLANSNDGGLLVKARDLIANYLWNEDGESEEWLVEAHAILNGMTGPEYHDFDAERLATPSGDRSEPDGGELG